MKKKIWIYILIAIPIVLIVLMFSFGLQIGNVRIGKQNDLRTVQSDQYSESLFYQEYFSKNNLTVVNTWATWCVPCIKEMPVLNKIKADFDLSNVEFISISVDKDSVKLVNFNNSNKFDFRDITIADLKYRNAILNLLEGRNPDEWISSHIVPVTYLINNGKVLHKSAGTIEEQELKKLIEKYK